MEILGVVSFLVFFLIQASFYSLTCIGLNIQWGFTGLFNVGIAGFFAVGAYASGIMTGPRYAETWFGGFGLPVPVGFLTAIVVTALVATIIGYVTLRLREDFLAISTFGIAVSIQLVANNLDELTRGPEGLYALPKPLSDLSESPLVDNAIYLGICVLVIGLVYWGFERILRSPWGRVLRAIREDEDAAMAMGKNVFVFRLQAFVLGSATMGLAGALYANFIGFISPTDFLPIFTIQVFVMVIVGGSGNNLGAIVGGVVMWGVWSASDSLIAAVVTPDFQTQAAAARIVLIGLILVLMLLYRPAGLLPEKHVVSAAGRLDPKDSG
jgi:branched-chain amino acid transport system permease protein